MTISTNPAIRYRVRIESAVHHLFRVSLAAPPNGQDETRLSLPNWLPGSYKIRDFARNVIEFSASCANNPISWRKLDKHRWTLQNNGAAFEVDYLVYGCDLSVRGTHLDDNHGYFNGSSLLIQPEPDDQWVYELTIEPGEDSWQLLTALPAVDIDSRGFGTYRAESYSHLIDHPVEMGLPEVCLFTVKGIPHRLAVSGPHFADLHTLTDSLKKICTCHCELFGELPIDDQYLFLLQLVSNGYGGLEHQNSTSLIASRGDLESPAPGGSKEKYHQFLALCSHEYFHLWNGKRIRPAAYLTPDLSTEIHSQLLWLVEGVTSYYDELGLVRAGVIEVNDYLDMLAKNLTRYFRGKGRTRQTLAESSFDSWTKFYQQDENAPNAIVSYYTKGGIVVMMIDLLLRRVSGGEYSFDDVMRHLWQCFGKAGIGVPEDAMPGIIEQATGFDLSEPMYHWIHTTDAIDEMLTDLLGDVGIGFALRCPRKQLDPGGVRAEWRPQSLPQPWLGVGHRQHNLGMEITHIHEDSPAAGAGLAVGDILLALGGFRCADDDIDSLLGRLAIHNTASVHLFRDDQLLQRELRLTSGPAHVAELWLQEDASPVQCQNRSTWLHQD